VHAVTEFAQHFDPTGSVPSRPLEKEQVITRYPRKGVWYRGHYLHDRSVASLEEMFNRDRLQETHEPGAWSPPGAKTRGIKGHEFGLNLKPEEREQLIAYVRTL
jgi:hypothetical protein